MRSSLEVCRPKGRQIPARVCTCRHSARSDRAREGIASTRALSRSGPRDLGPDVRSGGGPDEGSWGVRCDGRCRDRWPARRCITQAVDPEPGSAGSFARLDGHIELSEQHEQKPVFGVDQGLSGLEFLAPVDARGQGLQAESIADSLFSAPASRTEAERFGQLLAQR